MILTFIIADTNKHRILLQHENYDDGLNRRTVHIELTEGQVKAIGLKDAGIFMGKPSTEEIIDVFVDNSFPAPASEEVEK